MKIDIYTDGASRGNPGPASAGVFIKNFDQEVEKYLGETTNNVAEYEAIILGLLELKKIVGKSKTRNTEANFYGDSLLAIQQLNRRYKINHESIIPLFIKIHNLCTEYKNVSFNHISRENNKRADSIANRCLDNNKGLL